VSVSTEVLLTKVIDLAHEAGVRLAHEFNRRGGPRGHGDKAEIDTEIEWFLREELLRIHDCSYLGEETGRELRAGSADLWVIDPHDGTSAFLRGYRGSAVSIALLRKGRPILGVVCAPLSPDKGIDCISWADGCKAILRNGQPVITALAYQIRRGDIVFLNHNSVRTPVEFGKLVYPGRFLALPSIAYRLARVAACDGVAAVSLSSPGAVDYAAGHALLLGAGGDLLDETGNPVTYDDDGSSFVSQCFGGSRPVAMILARKHWSVRGEKRRSSLQLPARSAGSVDEGQISRARGCLMGQVIGDSLGSLVEFESAATIQARYPHGLRELADGGTWNTVAGQPTDDTELALALARTLVQTRQYDDEKIAEAYGCWYGSHPFDIGSTTRMALSAAHCSQNDKAIAARNGANRDSQSNGSLMRVSPIGVWAREPKIAALAAERDSKLSHPNQACVAACASFAAAIAQGIKTGDRDAMLRTAELFMGSPQNSLIREVLAAALTGSKPSGVDGPEQGWVAIAYQNAFYHLARGSALLNAARMPMRSDSHYSLTYRTNSRTGRSRPSLLGP
jgi:ADP-ribosyl-[dinitrogen reductase] hydrolase